MYSFPCKPNHSQKNRIIKIMVVVEMKLYQNSGTLNCTGTAIFILFSLGFQPNEPLFKGTDEISVMADVRDCLFLM